MNWSARATFLVVGLALLGVDAGMKAYIHYNVPHMAYASPIYPYGGIPVFQDWHGVDFAITHMTNKGAAWGIFASLQEYLLYLRLLIIGGLMTYLLFFKSTFFHKLSLLFVTIGAVGNVIDHFVYGHVVDMFYFTLWGYSYPVFNLADSAIFTGIVCLLLRSLVQKFKRAPQPA